MSDFREKAVEKLRPLFNLFTTTQVQMILMSWLPMFMDDRILSGIPMVDMFIFSMLSTLVVSFMDIATLIWEILWKRRTANSDDISFRVDPSRYNQYSQSVSNPYYAAVSWLITQGIRGLTTGGFVIQVAGECEEDGKILGFDILPEDNQKFHIIYKNEMYLVHMKPTAAKANREDG
ncbi:hypothetical protein BJ684DRAFT_19418, partial [Piptocephalis cylindrospora]